MICCHDDESTTNWISRTIRPISTWDTWKSFSIRVELIPDATAPIGTDLDLCQAYCEDGKENSETTPWWCPQELLNLSQYFPDLCDQILESHLHKSYFPTPKYGLKQMIGCWAIAFVTTNNKDGVKLCLIDVDPKNCCISINIVRIWTIRCSNLISMIWIFQRRSGRSKQTSGCGVIKFVTTNMMPCWTCDILLLTQIIVSLPTLVGFWW
jgi:hypothetical protein